MNGKVLSSSKAIWGLGLLAFAGLCFICISSHAPSLTAKESIPSLPSTSALYPSKLEARLLNGKVNLTGTLPDQAAKAQVLERAKGIYGDGNYLDNLRVSNQTVFPSANWFNTALSLLSFARRANNEGGFSLDGNTVTLRGLVDSEDIKAKLISDTTNAIGKGIRVDDKVLVKGKVSTAQASDFQTKLNGAIAGKIVEFDINSDVLTANGKVVLDEMVTVLRDSPGIPVEIGGHTDARGNPAANLDLSQRRARTCLQYLATKSVDAKRLTSKGYGSAKPIADNDTQEGQQRNRRIEFSVLKEGK